MSHVQGGHEDAGTGSAVQTQAGMFDDCLLIERVFYNVWSSTQNELDDDGDDENSALIWNLSWGATLRSVGVGGVVLRAKPSCRIKIWNFVG